MHHCFSSIMIFVLISIGFQMSHLRGKRVMHVQNRSEIKKLRLIEKSKELSFKTKKVQFRFRKLSVFPPSIMNLHHDTQWPSLLARFFVIYAPNLEINDLAGHYCMLKLGQQHLKIFFFFRYSGWYRRPNTFAAWTLSLRKFLKRNL